MSETTKTDVAAAIEALGGVKQVRILADAMPVIGRKYEHVRALVLAALDAHDGQADEYVDDVTISEEWCRSMMETCKRSDGRPDDDEELVCVGRGEIVAGTTEMRRAVSWIRNYARQASKWKTDYVDSVEAMLLAAGAPENIDEQERALSAVGKKPSDYIRHKMELSDRAITRQIEVNKGLREKIKGLEDALAASDRVFKRQAEDSAELMRQRDEQTLRANKLATKLAYQPDPDPEHAAKVEAWEKRIGSITTALHDFLRNEYRAAVAEGVALMRRPAPSEPQPAGLVKAAEALVEIVRKQCGGYTSGPGKEALDLALRLNEALEAEKERGPSPSVAALQHCKQVTDEVTEILREAGFAGTDGLADWARRAVAEIAARDEEIEKVYLELSEEIEAHEKSKERERVACDRIAEERDALKAERERLHLKLAELEAGLLRLSENAAINLSTCIDDDVYEEREDLIRELKELQLWREPAADGGEVGSGH